MDVVIEKVRQLGFDPVASENRPASDNPMASQYKDEVTGCEVYIGIFYKDYSKASIDEFDTACGPGIPTPVFEKSAGLGGNKPRDPKLSDGFRGITDIKIGPDGYLYILNYLDDKLYRIIPS